MNWPIDTLQHWQIVAIFTSLTKLIDFTKKKGGKEMLFAELINGLSYWQIANSHINTICSMKVNRLHLLLISILIDWTVCINCPVSFRTPLSLSHFSSPPPSTPLSNLSGVTSSARKTLGQHRRWYCSRLKNQLKVSYTIFIIGFQTLVWWSSRLTPGPGTTASDSASSNSVTVQPLIVFWSSRFRWSSETGPLF